MNVLTIGSVAYDTIIQVQPFDLLKDDLHLWAKDSYKSLGSTGAGKTLCLDALGISNTLVTMIGKDENGKKIKALLGKTKSKIYYYDSDKSIAHTNIMYGEGKRISTTTSYPSNEENIDCSKFEYLVKESDIVMLNINDFARGFIPFIKKHKKKCVVDLHDYDQINPHHKEFIEAGDYMFTSGISIKNPEDYMKKQIECGKLLSVVTLGSKGYVAMDSTGKTHRGQIFKGLPVIDSNGAGDSFSAGFTVELLKTGSIGKALSFANVCGAVSCSSKQLFHPDYSYEEIKRLQKKELI